MRFFGLRPNGLTDDDEYYSSEEDADEDDDDSESMSPAAVSKALSAFVNTTNNTSSVRGSVKAMGGASGMQPLATELINYLSFTHPLLTMHALSSHDEKFMSVMGDIIAALNYTMNIKHIMSCTLEQVPEWIEENVVLPAHTWVQKSAIYAMLQTFSPTLIRHNDMQLKETLHLLASKLCGMLARVSARASLLSADSPFWLLLELHRTVIRLQTARADLTACYSALAGDVHWNPHLHAVYTCAAHGRAIWAESRPLATWLASLEQHVQFLTSWDSESIEPAPFRIGSISSIASFFSSYSRDTERFHLRLEKKPSSWGAGTPSSLALSKAFADATSKGSSMGSPGRRNSAQSVSIVSIGEGTRAERHSKTSRLSRGTSPDDGAVEDAAPNKASTTSLLVEGLHLLGGSWTNNRICQGDGLPDSEFEVDLPAMVIRPMKGPPPKGTDWFSCPLIVAHPDSYGTDLASPPIAHVLVRTAVHPALCAIRGVRLVSYA